MTFRCAALVFCFFLGVSQTALAQPKAPVWYYDFELKCRKPGEQKLTKDTKAWRVEVYVDPNTGQGVYLCESGSVAVAPGFDAVKTRIEDPKAPEWTARWDLKIYADAEGERGRDAKLATWVVEVFYDGNTGHWIYINHEGRIGVTKGARGGRDAIKAPDWWTTSMVLHAGKAGKDRFDKGSPAYSIEVYEDVNTNNLIYFCHTGSMSVIPAPAVSDRFVRDRSSIRYEGGMKTKFGVELYSANGAYVLISEKGTIAVLPVLGRMGTGAFLHGLDLMTRKAGEKDFVKGKTKTWALETFWEPNLQAAVYVSETGSMAAGYWPIVLGDFSVDPKPRWKKIDEKIVKIDGGVVRKHSVKWTVRNSLGWEYPKELETDFGMNGDRLRLKFQEEVRVMVGKKARIAFEVGDKREALVELDGQQFETWKVTTLEQVRSGKLTMRIAGKTVTIPIDVHLGERQFEVKGLEKYRP